jgi:DNA-binding Lrp family transcriptional regulator
MPLAFILINTAKGSEDEVVKELKKMEGFIEVHTLFGMHDVIAKVEIGDKPDRLKEDVVWKIRMIKEVQSTTTLLVADSY